MLTENNVQETHLTLSEYEKMLYDELKRRLEGMGHTTEQAANEAEQMIYERRQEKEQEKEQAQKKKEQYLSAGIDCDLIILNDSVTDAAFDGTIQAETARLGNSKINIGTSKKIFAYANIVQAIEKDNTVQYPPLNNFDKQVYNVVYSLYEGGNVAISFPQIARFIGAVDEIKPTATILTDIIESVEKMIGYIATIDLSEATQKMKLDIRKPILKETLLSGAVCTFILDNRETGGIVLHSTPILARQLLARTKNSNAAAQMLRINKNYMKNIPLNSSKINTTLKGYILERVAEMQSHPQMSHRILVDTIINKLSNTGLEVNTPKDRNRLITKIKKILDGLKTLKQEDKDKNGKIKVTSSKGYVKGYEVVKERNRTIAFDIELNKH